VLLHLNYNNKDMCACFTANKDILTPPCLSGLRGHGAGPSLKCGMICSRLSLARLSASEASEWGHAQCTGTTFWAWL